MNILRVSILVLSCWTAALALSRPIRSTTAGIGERTRYPRRSERPGDSANPPQWVVDAAISIRGGAVESKSGIAATIGAYLDKFLRYLEKRSPSVAGHIQLFLEKIESITGVKFLPEKKKESKKKKKKRSKESSESSEQKASSKEEAEEAEETSAKMKSKKKQKASASSKKKSSSSNSLAASHVIKEVKTTSPNYRIQRELKAFLSDPPPNLKVKVGKNLRVWIVTMKGAKNTIYEGETFQLRVAFPAQYPTVPPSVYFLPPNIPIHEHVYTNGDICLSLLGKDWRPTMTAQSIAVSILSILSSAQSKSLPMDNARHAQNKPGEYQKDWVYHDDNC